MSHHNTHPAFRDKELLLLSVLCPVVTSTMDEDLFFSSPGEIEACSGASNRPQRRGKAALPQRARCLQRPAKVERVPLSLSLSLSLSLHCLARLRSAVRARRGVCCSVSSQSPHYVQTDWTTAGERERERGRGRDEGVREGERER